MHIERFKVIRCLLFIPILVAFFPLLLELFYFLNQTEVFLHFRFHEFLPFLFKKICFICHKTFPLPQNKDVSANKSLQCNTSRSFCKGSNPLTRQFSVSPADLHRLAAGRPRGFGLPAAVAHDWNLLVPVLPSHLLLLRQLPLLPRPLLLPTSP